ncbi:MAG: hypothetical protein ACOCUR_02595 [Nanoarchaeota archaeon]
MVIATKKFLEDIGLAPYLMTTGKKGYHVAVPIEPDSTFKEVRAFAGKIADTLVKAYPDSLTSELTIKKREDKIFLDVNRNSSKQTSVAPYSIRAQKGFPIAKPISWDELETSEPDTYTIFDDLGEDPWKDFDKRRVSINDVMKRLKE